MVIYIMSVSISKIPLEAVSYYLIIEDKDENIGIYTNLRANKTFSL
ncbi:hypothetical protein Neuguinea51_05960 [Helicobacter pylori]